MLPVALALFAQIPTGAQCSGSPLPVGAPIITSNGAGPPVGSIVELHDRSGDVVGWVYLTGAGSSAREYVQAAPSIEATDAKALKVEFESTSSSTIAPLDALPPTLHARPCTEAQAKITD